MGTMPVSKSIRAPLLNSQSENRTGRNIYFIKIHLRTDVIHASYKLVDLRILTFNIWKIDTACLLYLCILSVIFQGILLLLN